MWVHQTRTWRRKSDSFSLLFLHIANNSFMRYRDVRYLLLRKMKTRSASPSSRMNVEIRSPGFEQAYMRLATEFRGRGYGVRAPDPRSGIFNGRAAEQFVDQALNGAEFSVHLIGAEETPDRIVAMQLARARDRAGAAKAAGATMLFRRMIWAPRIFQAGGSRRRAVTRFTF